MRTRSILACLLFAAAAACSRPTAQPTAPAEPPATEAQRPAPTTPPVAPPTDVRAEADEWCPTNVPGTSVAVEDTQTGAALVFQTEGDVAEVRKRVEAIAEAHNEHQAQLRQQRGQHQQHHQQQEMQQQQEQELELERQQEQERQRVEGMTEPAPGTEMEPGAPTAEAEGARDLEEGAMPVQPEIIETTAVVVPTQDGARLEIATDPANVEEVQQQLRAEAVEMEAMCERMQPGGGASGY